MPTSPRVKQLCILRDVEDAVPYKCAVSDAQLSFLISVSEFTSVNVARVQRHAARDIGGTTLSRYIKINAGT